jgi:GGDEF domain-containing protein
LAERLRKSVEGQLFHWHDQTLRLTVSIGVSNGQVLSGSLTEALINYSLRRMSIFIVPKRRGEIAPVCVSRHWKKH